LTFASALRYFFYIHLDQRRNYSLCSDQRRLCSSPILHLPDLSQPFRIESDTSQYAIGSILKQGGHPIAYHSETLSEEKKNYSTYDKEFYSLVQALKQWRHYLLGKETILHTNHHPLIFINSQSKIHRPSMQPQVEKFIIACALCSQSKPSNWKHGLFQPLLLPSRLWESISMDLLSGLPTTQKKHDAIWVVVCRFSKMALFIPCTKTIIIVQTTKLYFHHVWPHFGLPRSIISDKDSCFLSTFWKTIWALLGCHLKFSTTFHPQTDGQTKVVNRVLVHALRTHFGRNKQLDNYLHILQHSYNKATHSSTVFSPFEVCLGFQLASPTELPLTWDPQGTVDQQQEQLSAEQFLQQIAQCHSVVTSTLKETQDHAK
jgi:hypothetical protein